MRAAAHQHADLAAVLLVAEAAAAEHDVDLVAQVREERGVDRLRRGGGVRGGEEGESQGALSLGTDGALQEAPWKTRAGGGAGLALARASRASSASDGGRGMTAVSPPVV